MNKDKLESEGSKDKCYEFGQCAECTIICSRQAPELGSELSLG